jgi:hypothetical protein
LTGDDDGKPLELQLLDGMKPEAAQEAPLPPPEETLTLGELRNTRPAPRRIVLPEREAPPLPPTVAGEASGLLAAGLPYVVALLVGFLPGEWRRRVGAEGLPWALAGLVGGVVQMVVVLLVGATLFHHFRDGALASVIAAAGEGVPVDNGILMGFGAALFLGFLLTPSGLLCVYFFTEGVFRAVSAGVTGEPLGTLPLWLAMKAHLWIEARHVEQRLGPLVVDEVTPRAEGGLEIATCRVRPWDALTTLSIEDRAYRVVSHEGRATGPRRHVYRLELAGPRHVIRRLTAYAPDELVKAWGRKPRHHSGGSDTGAA